MPGTNRVPRALFSEVLKKTKPYSLPGLRLRFYPNKTLKSSFAVSLRVAKKATERNIWKRRGYSVFRKIQNKLKKGTYLFFLQPEIKNISFAEFENKITLLLQKANLINE
ncbi:MAG TPA: ribonuclease P protein component [Candidatus Paceibacterota bacterium]|nr:ribonuclease P protein component [Candidatus Paceibacterota bacterium]